MTGWQSLFNPVQGRPLAEEAVANDRIIFDTAGSSGGLVVAGAGVASSCGAIRHKTGVAVAAGTRAEVILH